MPVTQELDSLLSALLAERPDVAAIAIPGGYQDKRRLLRMLMNIRAPGPLADELLAIQDRELARQLDDKGIVELAAILPSPLYPRLRLWQGDITRLRVDAIVNAANSALLGCFQPLHNCIDNVIHSQAGMQLRAECARLMQGQGHAEGTGLAKITSGYNLPASHVIHTVGPIVTGNRPTAEQARQLAACYESCLALAERNNLKSLAFCCISTGVFRFPQKEAAGIAVRTVLDFFETQDRGLETVVFDVFTATDLELYRRLLGWLC